MRKHSYIQATNHYSTSAVGNKHISVFTL